MASTLIYPAIIDFRDMLLKPSPIGVRMTEYFDRFYEEAVSIARADPELVTDIVWVVEYGSPFIRAMLGEDLSSRTFGPTPTTYLAEQLRPQTVEALVGVIDRFRRAASPEFIAALDDFETQVRGYVGLTPQEAVVKLRSKEV